MTSKTAKELLAESRALRLSFKKPVPEQPGVGGHFVAFSEPLIQPPKALPWNYWYCQVLSNPNHSWEDILINLYDSGPPVGNSLPSSAPVGTTVLVHNHSREERCYAKHKCYILGYTEGSNENSGKMEEPTIGNE